MVIKIMERKILNLKYRILIVKNALLTKCEVKMA